MMNGSIDKDAVIKVAKGLEPILDDLIFVGGAVVEVYANIEAPAPIRPTTDIDVVIELTGYGEYSSLQEKLAELGFHIDKDSEVICRYKYEGITVDIMPTDEEILGFSNIWYNQGIKHTFKYAISEDLKINLFETPYFMASKFEAFKGRGKDRRMSDDFEDIVYLLENRKGWAEEVHTSEPEVQEYLKNEFSKLLEERHSKEAIVAHLAGVSKTERSERIIKEIKKVLTD